MPKDSSPVDKAANSPASMTSSEERSPCDSVCAATTAVDQDSEKIFRLRDFFYDLPEELIAQQPLPGRSDSRLMVLNAPLSGHSSASDQVLPGGLLDRSSHVVPEDASGEDQRVATHIQHGSVRDLPRLLRAGDHLVFNNTKVIPARLYGAKATGGRVEVMLERVTTEGRVLAKIRASKSPKPGSSIVLAARQSRLTKGSIEATASDDSSAALDNTVSSDTPVAGPEVGFEARVVARQDDLFELEAVNGCNSDLTDFIAEQGEIPLPPYIERAPRDSDKDRYQTVYAQFPGAVAAPTAGLHFDERLFEALAEAGITHSFITLHVGAGTFQPVRVENPAEHVMHAERVTVDVTTVHEIEQARARGARIIAVGTTSVRALEAAAAQTGQLAPFDGETRLFLVPGASFHVVDAMVTNFHLPESTLLMLVASFAGLDATMQAYRQAVEQRYRFFSYGDAMLVWPQPGVRT